MNLTTILTEVRDIIGETSADFWSDAELTRHVNEGLRRFAGENRWSWLLTEGTGTLTAGATDFDLEGGVSDFRHMSIIATRLGDTRPYRIERVSPARGFQLRAENYTPSTYVRWFYLASATTQGTGEVIATIRFVPESTEDTDLAYQYYREPAVLSGTDTPDVPLAYHKALVHYAAATAWLKELNGGGKAAEQFSLYDAIVAEAREDEESSADGEFLIVGGQDDSRAGLYLTAQDYTLRRIEPTLGP